MKGGGGGRGKSESGEGVGGRLELGGGGRWGEVGGGWRGAGA